MCGSVKAGVHGWLQGVASMQNHADLFWLPGGSLAILNALQKLLI
jgi:hypothetical protein